MRLALLLLVVAFLALPLLALGGDEAAAVRKAVLDPQEAGWGRHDFKAYMSQWADGARMIVGRGEHAGKHDTVFDRKQIEATRRLLMHGKVPADQKLAFADVKVKVRGDQAELRVRTTMSFGGGYETVGELYQLRKTAAGWKVYLNRGWFLKTKHGDQVTVFDADTWKKLDEDADTLVQADRRGERAAQALLAARRFQEAHALLKKVTAGKDAAAADWLLRGNAALGVGHADDALAAFRNALRLDEGAPVPPFAREGRKE
jgi:hypothetical protein